MINGSKVCPRCHTHNPADADYCVKCSLKIKSVLPVNNPDQDAAVRSESNRWVRFPDDFAARIDAGNLRGLFQRALTVEEGTNAMIIAGDMDQGVLTPGTYCLENLPQRLLNWVNGGGNRASILLVDVTPTDLEFKINGIFTRDPLQVGMTIHLQVAVGKPSVFLSSILKGRERFTGEDLKQYLYPQILQAAREWSGSLSIQQLSNDLSLKAQFETLLETTLTTTFRYSGLRFIQVRALSFDLEHIDRIKGIESQYALQVSEAEARAAGRTRLLDVSRELDLIGLAETTQRVYTEEQRIELMQRMRQALLNDQMNEVNTRVEFERFMDQIDRDRLLRQHQREELLQTWEDEKQDKDKARAHLLARLEAERGFELRMIALKQKGELDQVALDQEQAIARKRAEFQYRMELKSAEDELVLVQKKHLVSRARWEEELERSKVQQEINRIEREEDLADANLLLHIRKSVEENRRKEKEVNLQIQRLDEEERLRIQREDEIFRRRAFQELELEKMEAEERRLAAARDFELRRLQELSHLSLEALISVTPGVQAAILADLRRTELLKNLSEEQILAMAAERSPEIARAFQEKYRAAANGQLTQREQELYNTLLSEQDRSLRGLREDHLRQMEAMDKAQEQLQHLAEHGMDRIADMGRSRADDPDRVFIVGSQGVQTVASTGTLSSDNTMRQCSKCRQMVSADLSFCPHCGNKLEGEDF